MFRLPVDSRSSPTAVGPSSLCGLWFLFLVITLGARGQPGPRILLQEPELTESALVLRWNATGKITSVRLFIFAGEVISGNPIWESELLEPSAGELSVPNTLPKNQGGEFTCVLRAFQRSRVIDEQSRVFHYSPKQQRWGLLAFLKGLAASRPPLEAVAPRGKIMPGRPIEYRWSFELKQGSPMAGFKIRLVEQPERVDSLRWFSELIPVASRSYPATNLAETGGTTYEWGIEAYRSVTQVPSLRDDASFTFLTEAQATEVSHVESQINSWLNDDPRDSHLLLLLGWYYAKQGMDSDAGSAFSRFLNLPDSDIRSHRAIGTLVNDRLQPIKQQRQVLYKELVAAQPGSRQVEVLGDLLRSDLMLLDFDDAVWAIDWILTLASEASDEKASDKWRPIKKRIEVEREIYAGPG